MQTTSEDRFSRSEHGTVRLLSRQGSLSAGAKVPPLPQSGKVWKVWSEAYASASVSLSSMTSASNSANSSPREPSLGASAYLSVRAQ